MLVSDMMDPGGRVFMKSEFGPIGDNWPCFSYTRKNVGQRLRADFRPGRDIVIYVGTTNPKMTKDPDHRSRIISAVSIEPTQILETRKIIPEDQWLETVMEFGEDASPYSMAVLEAAVMIGPPYPEARVVIPVTYASFAEIQNRGNVIEAVGDEREAVMALSAQPHRPTIETWQPSGNTSVAQYSNAQDRSNFFISPRDGGSDSPNPRWPPRITSRMSSNLVAHNRCRHGV